LTEEIKIEECVQRTWVSLLPAKVGKILIFKSFLFSGYQPEMTDLLILTEVIGTTAYKEFDYNILEGHTIYTTISCENNAGLFSILSSNGVRISEHSPSIPFCISYLCYFLIYVYEWWEDGN
jgi:hypothetical protein